MKTAENAGENVSDHFADVGKMVDLGSPKFPKLTDQLLLFFNIIKKYIKTL